MSAKALVSVYWRTCAFVVQQMVFWLLKLIDFPLLTTSSMINTEIFEGGSWINQERIVHKNLIDLCSIKSCRRRLCLPMDKRS